jgi:hypothetical protein
VVGFPEKCAIGIKRDICLCQHLASSAPIRSYATLGRHSDERRPGISLIALSSCEL